MKYGTCVNIGIHGIEGRYARALLSVASKKNELKRVTSELKKIESAIKGSDMFNEILYNPVIGKSRKMNFVVETLKKQSYSPTMINFFLVLSENGRLNIVENIIRVFESLIQTDAGAVSVNLVLAKVRHRDYIPFS